VINAADSSNYVVKITADGVTLDGFTITGLANGDENQAAVITWGVDNCTITNNILTDNYKDAINLYSIDGAYSDYNTVSNNVINGPNGVGETFGIKIKGSHNTISNNEIYNADTSIHVWSWDASETASPDYNIISGNTIAQGESGTANHKYGITLKTGRYNEVFGNTISVTRAGIHLYTSDRMETEADFDPRPANNIINGNIITGGEVGIVLLEGANTNTISGNTISGTTIAGILGSLSRWPGDWSDSPSTYLIGTPQQYLQITGNTFTDNTLDNCGHGIAMEYADNNIIGQSDRGNTIKNNADTTAIDYHGVSFAADYAGIYFDANSESNVVNYNNIVDNTGSLKSDNNLDATNNWWGSDDPKFDELVTGDVDTDPWWTTPTGNPSKKMEITANDIYSNETLPTLTWDVTAVPSGTYELEFKKSDTETITVTGLTTNQYELPELADGEYDWRVKGQNAPNNYEETGWKDAKLYVDTTAPTGTITINNGEAVTNTATVNLSFTYNDAYEMRYGEKPFSIDEEGEWVDVDTTGEYEFDSEGYKTLYVQFKDRAGNVSKNYSVSIYYKKTAENITEENVTDTTTSVDYENIGLTKDDGTKPIATENAKITFSQFTGNPEGAHSGITSFGKYFDISVDNPDSIDWPITVKLYFTQDDLNGANITNPENQIKGLYYWNRNSSSWELYENTGVIIDDDAKLGYLGYVWANINHFTPMSLGADITAPDAPSNFKAEAQDGSVKLTWDKVDDTLKYTVRYRKATGNDNNAYSYIDTNSTELTVYGLENNQMYEFGVSSMDNAQNQGQWAIVNALPEKSSSDDTTSSSTIIPAKKTLWGYRGYGTAYAKDEQKDKDENANKDEENKNDEDETEIETISPEGNVEGATDAEDTQEENRAIVTIAILIIAAGAGLGGYYGYQWWMGKEAVETEVKTKSGKKDKGGRW
ncbi:right-handed parallel beta-helix repeat-containing protein, partial [candidate division WOR-3 bacterium]|nr:right-handed parallel beta-helix repeat-containing protein [candidate division WOR-3 bacterium]